MEEVFWSFLEGNSREGTTGNFSSFNPKSHFSFKNHANPCAHTAPRCRPVSITRRPQPLSTARAERQTSTARFTARSGLSLRARSRGEGTRQGTEGIRISAGTRGSSPPRWCRSPGAAPSRPSRAPRASPQGAPCPPPLTRTLPGGGGSSGAVSPVSPSSSSSSSRRWRADRYQPWAGSGRTRPGPQGGTAAIAPRASEGSAGGGAKGGRGQLGGRGYGWGAEPPCPPRRRPSRGGVTMGVVSARPRPLGAAAMTRAHGARGPAWGEGGAGWGGQREFPEGRAGQTGIVWAGKGWALPMGALGTGGRGLQPHPAFISCV